MASLRTDPTAAAAAGSGDDRASWTCIGERTGWGASGWYAQLQEVEEGGAVYEVEVDRIQNEAAACCAADLLTMWDCHRNRRWPADPRRLHFAPGICWQLTATLQLQMSRQAMAEKLASWRDSGMLQRLAGAASRAAAAPEAGAGVGVAAAAGKEAGAEAAAGEAAAAAATAAATTIGVGADAPALEAPAAPGGEPAPAHAAPGPSAAAAAGQAMRAAAAQGGAVQAAAGGAAGRGAAAAATAGDEDDDDDLVSLEVAPPAEELGAPGSTWMVHRKADGVKVVIVRLSGSALEGGAICLPTSVVDLLGGPAAEQPKSIILRCPGNGRHYNLFMESTQSSSKLSGWESLLRDHGAGVGAWLMLAKPARYFTVYVYLRGSANGRTLAKALQTQLDRARQEAGGPGSSSCGAVALQGNSCGVSDAKSRPQDGA